MAERGHRSAAEREAARRERANRRARRAGRPEPYAPEDAELADAPAGFAAPGSGSPGEPEPLVAPRPPAAGQPPAEPAPAPPAAEQPPAEPAPAPAPSVGEQPSAEPAPAESPPTPSDPPPTPSDPPPTRSDPLVETRDSPIRSFPSPPDPEFYVPDAELETPAGTRRVSRASARPTGGGSRGSGRPPRAPRRSPSGPARRPHRWRARIAALLGLLLAAVIIVLILEVFQPFGTSPHGSVTVHIPENSSVDSVARRLSHAGVISSSLFFEVRVTLDGDRSHIRAGTYHLRKGMSDGAVLKRLTAVPKAAKTTELTIAEGHTRQYVAALLAHQHIRGNYLVATRHSALLNPRSYGAPKSTHTLEGFLFPDTFSLLDPVRVSALVRDQLRDFKRRFASVNLTQAHRLHHSSFQVVTIASLIEAESASPGDDRLVSSVIENRLRDGMMLQLDSTARYATGNFAKPLTESQLESKNPYNTHTHFGLPPGPIDSPGLTALNAAAHPARSRYLYFFSKPCTDRTVFAKSYGQFQILLVRDHRSHCPK